MVRAGKVENCQVGVYACLGRDTQVCLTDFRLYLPEAWTQDLARLDKAKVPEQCRVHKTKHEQAWEMIVHARKQGLRFGWVGFDCLYGSKRELLNAVEDLGERFVGDVARTTKRYGRNNYNWRNRARAGDDPRRTSGSARPTPHSIAAWKHWPRSTSSRHTNGSNTAQAPRGSVDSWIWVSTVWTWEPRHTGATRAFTDHPTRCR
ncbi:MAG: transposase [Candidatus Synoicihabitans palmerolidicus]|nr:transposase [Candidatus Synoicihabitans palmerolidicus]